MVNPGKFGILLRDHPDWNLVYFIISGFRNGFSLCSNAPHRNFDAVNLKSAHDNPEVLLQKVSKEVAFGRVLGPFRRWPLPFLFTSPLGLVKKTHQPIGQPKKWHLITHLSSPPGMGVNHFIKDVDASVQYASFNEALHLVRVQGEGCFMVKSD